MKARLPYFFSVEPASDLVRIGRAFDGGYIASISDVEKADLLISGGVNDDWSFEQHFVKLNRIPVQAFDASVNWRFFLKKSLLETIKAPLSFYAIRKFISYHYFFREERSHFPKFIGPQTIGGRYVSISDIFKGISAENIFLKIDIEGGEYRILTEIIEFQDRICGLVIEFHDCDLHLKRIKKFIECFNLDLIHVHANNYADVLSETGMPLALELTFSRYASQSNGQKVVRNLDMPNNPRTDEIELSIDT